MRPATIVENLRRRRVMVFLAVATVLTATTSAVAATSAVSPPQVLNYQVYVGGKGKAKPNLSPVVLGFCFSWYWSRMDCEVLVLTVLMILHLTDRGSAPSAAWFWRYSSFRCWSGRRGWHRCRGLSP